MRLTIDIKTRDSSCRGRNIEPGVKGGKSAVRNECIVEKTEQAVNETFSFHPSIVWR